MVFSLVLRAFTVEKRRSSGSPGNLWSSRVVRNRSAERTVSYGYVCLFVDSFINAGSRHFQVRSRQEARSVLVSVCG